MLSFKRIDLEDKKIIDPYLRESGYNLCEYCFGNLYIWQGRFKTAYTIKDGFLLLKGCFDGKCYYLMPCGNGDFISAARQLLEDAMESGHRFIMHCISCERAEELSAAFGDNIAFTPNETAFDYIYDRESLSNLIGQKYHSKRNFINRFIYEYGEAEYEDITPQNIAECRKISDVWLRDNYSEVTEAMLNEKEAIIRLLNNFFPLDMRGAIIRINGKICAFTAGEELNGDTFVIHIEKASYDITGAYAVINNEFAKRALEGYKYINREEDMGLEGLRKAKRSYNPAFMGKKFTAEIKDEK